jgi:hypothetical protein
LIAAGLLQTFAGQAWPLAVYIMIIAGISLVSVQRLPETARKQLDS